MEKRLIKRNGNSIGISLDRKTLKNVYRLDENDEVQVDYDYPDIVIRIPKAQERFRRKK